MSAPTFDAVQSFRHLSLKPSIALGITFLLGISAGAKAATQCVNSKGTSGCFTTISAAVTAATAGDTISVAPGTYKELVTINKSLALIGQNPANTTINATGLANAVYINGASNVTVTGLTLTAANYEGILAYGASSITIWGNIVQGNNKLLQPSPTSPSCPGLGTTPLNGTTTIVYAFEANEQNDCGEGIHLSGVRTSVVSYNIVENNSGGILVSDDTAAAYDNLIRNNTITNNIYAGGITLAAYGNNGVFHNTITGNQVFNNGTSPINGGGPGVALYSLQGPVANFGNSISGNNLFGNGTAGIALHTKMPYAAGVQEEELEDQVITGNFIARNGADTALGLTSSQGDGISMLFVGGFVSGFTISGNTFSDEAEDIAISTNISVQITATLNLFDGKGIGIDVLGPPPGYANSPSDIGNVTVNATQNWWGCSGGPGAKGCSNFVNTISSGPLASQVLATPWLANPGFYPSFGFTDSDR
jgi:parallel beta-helix repeat protein